MGEARILVARVQGRLDAEDWRVGIEAGAHRLTSDEPVERGGADAGAAPYELLLAGLAACTAITLRMYAQRKGWDLRAVEVEARLFKSRDNTHVERTLVLQGGLTAEQIERLLEIGEKTPVTLTLKAGVRIDTTLRGQ